MPDGTAEEADLRPVENGLRNEPTGGRPQNRLGRAAGQLERDRHSRTQLDEAVVEKRDAHLEGARHRGPIEVVEHVVDEAQLRVQDERARQPMTRRAVDPIGQRRSRQQTGGPARARRAPNANGPSPATPISRSCRRRPDRRLQRRLFPDECEPVRQRLPPRPQRAAPMPGPGSSARWPRPGGSGRIRRAARPRLDPRARPSRDVP